MVDVVDVDADPDAADADPDAADADPDAADAAFGVTAAIAVLRAKLCEI